MFKRAMLEAEIEQRFQPGVAMGSFVLTDEEFRLFQHLVRDQTGINLGDHKRALLCARLSKRLRQHGLTRFQDYYDYLTTLDPDRKELRQMINAITTNKTDFFRERHHFDFLRQVVFPTLRDRWAHTGERGVRVWSAGCATGEEPYTIAIVLKEAMGSSCGWDIRILASDIDTDVLAAADAGIYPEEKIAAIAPELRRRYFERGQEAQEGLVRVKQELRKLITFRTMNLLDTHWPIQIRFDCIFCRNVTIYFDKPTQRQVVERFGRYLKDDGFLFVGHSESLFGVSDLYEHAGGTVYRKVAPPTRRIGIGER